MIDGKEHWQQEESDIPKIPMPISPDILKNDGVKDLTFCELCETNSRKLDSYGWYCEECKSY